MAQCEEMPVVTTLCRFLNGVAEVCMHCTECRRPIGEIPERNEMQLELTSKLTTL